MKTFQFAEPYLQWGVQRKSCPHKHYIHNIKQKWLFMMKVSGHKCHRLYSRSVDFWDAVDTMRRIHFIAVSGSCGWNLRSFLIGNVNERISSTSCMSSLFTALWKCFKLNPHCTPTCINNTEHEGKRVKKQLLWCIRRHLMPDRLFQGCHSYRLIGSLCGK